MLRISFILTAMVFILSACSQQQAETRGGAFDPYQAGGQPQASLPETTSQMPTYARTQKVALLLPLSGQHKQIGESLYNAAQMALFDMNDPSVELLPLDTKGTAAGTNEAMANAVRNNVKIVLGPLLADNVDRAGIVARRYNLNVIGFTTDSTRTGDNVFTVGILPYDQGQRLAQFAGKNNLKRVIALLPNTPYAQDVTKAFEQTAAANGITVVQKIAVGQTTDAMQLAQSLGAKRSEFDAILMPFGNPLLSSMAQALSANGLAATNIAWLGAGLWDDPVIISNPVMRGALYAAPSAQTRRNFEQQYAAAYGESPQRLASLGYDATALAIVLLRQTGGNITTQDLLNPNGFSGIDGVFRFSRNGMTERGMAIQRIEGNRQTIIVDQAPTTFTTKVSSN